jgi:hypothetical protein
VPNIHTCLNMQFETSAWDRLVLLALGAMEMAAANKDDAMLCLDIARSAREAGNMDKALQFAKKAHALYPCHQVLRPQIPHHEFLNHAQQDSCIARALTSRSP